jgi:hypothetical protein
MDLGHLDRLSQGERRQDSGQASRQHGLPSPRRPDQKEIVGKTGSRWRWSETAGFSAGQQATLDGQRLATPCQLSCAICCSSQLRLAVADCPKVGGQTRRSSTSKLASEDALKTGALGFMSRRLVQAGLPNRRPDGVSFIRRNGDLTFSITAHPSLGLLYGRYPRLLLIWATTEAVRTRNPVLRLGPTLTAFMAQLGLVPAGGRWGTIARLRDQMVRLFSSTVAFTRDRRATGVWRDSGFRLARRAHLRPSNVWRSTFRQQSSLDAAGARG